MSDEVTNRIDIVKPSRFLKLMRNGKVKGPQQNGFDQGKLMEELMRLNEERGVDLEDVELALSANFFDKLFMALRGKINQQLSSSFPSRNKSIRGVVAVSNFEWLKFKEFSRESIEGEKSFIPEELEQRKLPTITGNPAHFTNAIDAHVDGLKYELARCYGLKESSDEAEFEDPHMLASQALVSLAGYYGVLEHYWMQTVWNEYRVHTTKEGTSVLYPKNPSLHQNLVVGMRRRMSLNTERSMYWASFTKNLKDEGSLDAYFGEKRIVSVYKKKGVFRLKPALANRFKEEIWAQPGIKDVLYQDFLQEVLDRKFESLLGLKPQQFLDAYEILNLIPYQISKYVQKRTYYKEWKQVQQLVPVFLFSELKGVFVEILGISDKQAQFIVEFLTFKPSYRSVLWFTPLLPLSENEFTLAMASVDGINYIRMADNLISQFKDIRKFADKAFEKYIRGSFSSCVRGSTVADQASVYGSSYSPKDKEVGDIDLLFRLGNIIWVVEAKSTENAYDPLETYHTLDRIISEGCVQVERKKKFIQENLEEISKLLGYRAALDELKVDGFIVVSNAVFAGAVVNGVPVVDEFILRLFFTEGELKREGYLNDEMERIHLSRIQFYRRKDEAADGFRTYIYDPPQTRTLLKGIVVERSVLPSSDESEELNSIVVHYDIQLPLENMRQFIHKVGVKRGDMKTSPD